jgi:hypothetical protein
VRQGWVLAFAGFVGWWAARCGSFEVESSLPGARGWWVGGSIHLKEKLPLLSTITSIKFFPS